MTKKEEPNFARDPFIWGCIIGLLWLAFIIIFSGCTTDHEKQMQEVDALSEQISIVTSEYKSVKGQLNHMRNEADSLEQLIQEREIVADGGAVKYIITFKLKQSHFSLDIDKHIKDAMNAIKFNIMVDKDFYNSVEVGDKVVNDFRVGSFIMNGSFGNWKMKVIDKQIING